MYRPIGDLRDARLFLGIFRIGVHRVGLEAKMHEVSSVHKKHCKTVTKFLYCDLWSQRSTSNVEWGVDRFKHFGKDEVGW
jgi:hypothetical protein